MAKLVISGLFMTLLLSVGCGEEEPGGGAGGVGSDPGQATVLLRHGLSCRDSDGCVDVRLRVEVLESSGPVGGVRVWRRNDGIPELLAELDTPPYSYEWSCAPNGIYVLWAEITDGTQPIGVSDEVKVVITDDHSLMPTSYYIEELPPLEGDQSSFPWEINNLGVVVGYSFEPDGGRRPVLWIDHEPRPLPVERGDAYSINDRGFVSGTVLRPGEPDVAFVWAPQEALGPSAPGLPPGSAVAPPETGLSSNFLVRLLGDGTVDSKAVTINNANQVLVDVGGEWAIYADGEFRHSGELGGFYPVEVGARHLNHVGQLAATFAPGLPTSQGFLWKEGEPIENLGEPGLPSRATAINDWGEAVGWAPTGSEAVDNDALWRGFYWGEDGTVHKLDRRALPMDINLSGQIVGGQAWTGGGTWVAACGEKENLEPLIRVRSVPEGTTPAAERWRLSSARGINDAGQIVGSGRNPDGEDRAFVLTPVYE